MTGGRSDITAAVAQHLVTYVRRAAGEGAARQVASEAGFSPDDPRLGPGQHWITGEEIFRVDAAGGNADFLVGAGDPGGALAVAVAHTPRMITVRRYDIVERGDEHAVVESRALHPSAAHPVHCQMLAGHWAQIPGLFGVIGAVTDPQCTARGDECCRLVVRWVGRPRPPRSAAPAAGAGSTSWSVGSRPCRRWPRSWPPSTTSAWRSSGSSTGPARRCSPAGSWSPSALTPT